MRQANDGVPIAAIVARETTEKRWQGTGSGIGFGTGGLGLMFGGAAGTTTEQSSRARGFALPAVTDLRSFWILGPSICVLIAIASISAGADMMSGIMWDGSNVPPVFARLLSVMPTIIHVLAVVGVLGVGLALMLGSNPRAKQEEDRVARDTEAYQEMQKVHARLRYVEADHVIFDPVTGQEVSANHGDMIRLVETLASGRGPRD